MIDGPASRRLWLSAIGGGDAVGMLLPILFLLALAHALAALLIGIAQPILDLHAFRQTQTALTAYWLTQGGPWLDYETPVLGAPWSIPFEFPVYQLVVASVASLGVPLDIAGRIVAFGFLLATLWPLRMLCRELQLSALTWLITATLLLASPMYVFWSRTFLIESCAVFLAMLWLALLVGYLNRRDWRVAVLAVGAGCLAVLTKATTYPAFAAFGGLLAAFALAQAIHRREPAMRTVQLAGICALIGGVPLLAVYAWVGYSDQVKAANEFGRLFTSSALSFWNYGVYQQRVGRELWVDIILLRVLPEVLGTFFLLGLLAIVIAFTGRRSAALAAGALIAFLTPLLIFTNLHIVHNYYQYANGLFLILAAGLGIARLHVAGWRVTALVVLAVLVAGQFHEFRQRFAPLLTADLAQNRLLQIAGIARQATTPEQSLIIIGDDWSSTVPYYSQRKSLALVQGADPSLIRRVLDDPQGYLDDRPLGGIVYCPNRLAAYRAGSVPLIRAFVEGRAVLGEFGGCQFLAATR